MGRPDLVRTGMQIIARCDRHRAMPEHEACMIKVLLCHRCSREVAQGVQGNSGQRVALTPCKRNAALKLMLPGLAVQLRAVVRHK